MPLTNERKRGVAARPAQQRVAAVLQARFSVFHDRYYPADREARRRWHHT